MSSNVTKAWLLGENSTSLTNVDSTTAIIGASATLAAPTTADVSLRQDITALAIQQAIGDNSVAYNLPNSFVDQFEDSTGIASLSTAERNTTNEYVMMTTPNPNAITNNTDSPYNLTQYAAPYHTTTAVTNLVASGATTSIYVHDANGFMDVDMGLGHFAPGAPTGSSAIDPGNWTVEYWIRHFSGSTTIWHTAWRMGPSRAATTGIISGPETGKDHLGMGRYDGSYQSVPAVSFYMSFYGDSVTNQSGYYDVGGASQVHAMDTWIHMAFVRHNTNVYMYMDGVNKKTHAIGNGAWGGSTADSTGIRYIRFGNNDSRFYLDDFRISQGIARYPSGTTFTKPAVRHTTDSYTKLLIQSNDTNASTVMTDSSESKAVSVGGNIVSTTTTVSSSKTKVSGVLLYKNDTGTATFGSADSTHLEVLFTCDGSTYTTAASYTIVTPEFSTGIKMLKIGETTCGAGTSIGYKVVWKNQVRGSVITQLHGIGLNY
jgi:hypothetical protein